MTTPPHLMESDAIKNDIVPIASLMPHPRNYRTHPDTQIVQLRASLQRFGQVRSIVVQAHPSGRYRIVAGHGLVTAMQDSHYMHVRADIVPASWTEEQITGYLVADNLTTLRAEDDQLALAQLLQEKQQADFDLASLGSSDGDLQALLDQLSASLPESVAEGDAAPSRGSSPKPALIQVVVAVPALAPIEAALQHTGLVNRGEALLQVCATYLQIMRQERPDAAG